MRLLKVRSAWWGAIALGAFLPALLQGSASGDFLIASDGEAKASLITNLQPNAYELEAQRELSGYLMRISGAQLPSVRGTVSEAAEGTSPILIGRAAIEFGHLRMPRREFGEDGFMVKVQGGALLVAGASPRGTLFAAYQLLEEIGCRWYFPGEFGEVVPQRRTVTIPNLDISSKPDFRFRQIWTGADKAGQLWAERNRMGVGSSLAGESLEGLIPPEEFFTDHPEFYALVGGVRRPPHLCLSNPQVLEIAVTRALQFFRRNPQVDTLLLFDPEPGGSCEDEGCRALDVGEVDPVTGLPSTTDRALRFANTVAERVNQEMAGKSFLFLAGGTTAPPPRRESVNKAVIPVISTSAFCPFHSPASRACLSSKVLDLYLRRWCALSSQVRVMIEDPMAAGRELTFPRTRFLGETLRYLRELGVVGVELTGDGSWVASGLDRYLAARLLWDAEQDSSSVVGEFYSGFYGTSGGEMRTFAELIENAVGSADLHRADAVAAGLVFGPEMMSVLSWHLQAANQVAVLTSSKHHLELPNFQFRYLSSFLGTIERENAGKFTEALRFANNASRILHQMAQEQGDLFISEPHPLAELQSRLAEDAAKVGADGGAMLVLLPREAKFRADPEGLGEAEEWFLPGYDDSGWATLSRDYPLELQGFEDFRGSGFYRIAFRAGQLSPGTNYALRFVNLCGEASIYLNGIFLGRKWNVSGGQAAQPAAPAGVEFDLNGVLLAGQTNVLAVKVRQAGLAAYSGSCGPIYIYPK